MDCDRIWDMLSVYADGEASRDEASLVETHVAHCTSCAEDLKFMRSTSVAIQTAPEVEPPVELRMAILAATTQRLTLAERFAGAVRRTLSPVPVRYGALAAAGAAAAMALLTMNDGQHLATSPAAYHPAATPGPVTLGAVDVPGDIARSLPLVQTDQGQRLRPRLRKLVQVAHVSTGTSIHRLVAAPAARPTAPAAPERRTPDFRAKVPTTSALEPDAAVDDPVLPADDSAPAAAPSTPAPTTMEASAPDADRSTHTLMIASSTPVSAGQVATLADLKRVLREPAPGVAAANLRRSLRDKEIRVDVVRGSF